MSFRLQNITVQYVSHGSQNFVHKFTVPWFSVGLNLSRPSQAIQLHSMYLNSFSFTNRCPAYSLLQKAKFDRCRFSFSVRTWSFEWGCVFMESQSSLMCKSQSGQKRLSPDKIKLAVLSISLRKLVNLSAQAIRDSHSFALLLCIAFKTFIISWTFWSIRYLRKVLQSLGEYTQWQASNAATLKMPRVMRLLISGS